jgi:hypothetical protein
MPHNYTRIEDTSENSAATNERIASMEMGDGVRSNEDVRVLYRQPVQYTIIGVLILTALYFFQSYMSPHGSPGTPNSFCPPCTFPQCESAGCDQAASPMVCIGGVSAGGCGVAEKDWEHNPDCEACCDSSHCSTTVPSGDDDTIELCPECPPDQCDSVATTCGLNAYMCLKGEAAGGCTTDKYHWPTAEGRICEKCCDGAKC